MKIESEFYEKEAFFEHVFLELADNNCGIKREIRFYLRISLIHLPATYTVFTKNNRTAFSYLLETGQKSHTQIPPPP